MSVCFYVQYAYNNFIAKFKDVAMEILLFHVQ